MAHLVPETLKSAVTRLREDLHGALDRWLHRRHQHLDGIDIEDKGDSILIEAAMPGVDPNDVSIEVRDDRLIMHGEKKFDTEKRGKNYYYAEHGLGAVTRVVPLPFEVDAKRASAKYKNGLLRVELPKTQEAKQRQVRVRVA
jgi:HSP20 family protein